MKRLIVEITIRIDNLAICLIQCIKFFLGKEIVFKNTTNL